MGPGLASPYSAAVARPVGASSKGDSTELRPELLYTPGQQARCRPTNPDYRTTFVFDNDYPALLPDTPTAEMNLDGLLSAVMISPQKQKFGQRGI
jgi:UDPglucose--hexose-1-phosphate uridylyltransferase